MLACCAWRHCGRYQILCVQDKANEQPLWKKADVYEAWLYQNKLLACSISLSLRKPRHRVLHTEFSHRCSPSSSLGWGIGVSVAKKHGGGSLTGIAAFSTRLLLRTGFYNRTFIEPYDSTDIDSL